MVGKTKSRTKADDERIDILTREIGCLCCILKGFDRYQPSEYHHIVEGYKRLGHDYGLPLCPWHHRGIVPDGHSKQTVMGRLGMSLALSKREFKADFGNEHQLKKTADFALSLWKQHKFTMDRNWASAIRRFHGEQ